MLLRCGIFQLSRVSIAYNRSGNTIFTALLPEEVKDLQLCRLEHCKVKTMQLKRLYQICHYGVWNEPKLSHQLWW